MSAFEFIDVAEYVGMQVVKHDHRVLGNVLQIPGEQWIPRRGESRLGTSIYPTREEAAKALLHWVGAVGARAPATPPA